MQDRVGLEAPGQSLFQGSDSIHINAGIHRQEEDEDQEDQKRREKEIGYLVTHAFDDLDNEDNTSSMNSSRAADVSKEMNQSQITNCSIPPVSNDKGPTLSQYQNDFGTYVSRGTVNNSIYSLDTQRFSDITEPNASDIEFSQYEPLETSLNNNKENNSLRSIVKSPYDLPRSPSATNPTLFKHDFNPQIDKNYTLLDNCPATYNTPRSRYNFIRNENFPNNGYIESHEKINPYQNFGDTCADDNEYNSDHYNHCYKESSSDRKVNAIDAYKTADYNSKDQLEILCSVKIRQIERLSEELRIIKMEKKAEHDELSKKLTQALEDIEKSNTLKNEAENTVIEVKADVMRLQSQAISYKEKIAVLEKANENLMKELSEAQDSIQDLQQKISILERVQNLQSNDKTHEKFLKQMQEKHAIEMKNMQTQINVLTDKLNEKESAYFDLEHKLTDVRRAHDSVIAEKAEIINRLHMSLDECQKKCQNLMASNGAQEIMQLKSQIKLLTDDKENLLMNIRELQNKLDVAKADAVQYDFALTTTLNDESDSINQLKLGKLYNNSDTTNKLRSELQRCMAGQAIKRKNITRLENLLAQKDEELQKIRTIAESNCGQAAHYAKRVNDLEQQLRTLNEDHSTKIATEIRQLSDHLTSEKKQNENLMREKQELEEKLETTLATQNNYIRKVQEEITLHQEKVISDKYRKEYSEIHEKTIESIRQEAEMELVQLKVQLEQTQKELDHVKQLYIDVCGTKEQLINDHKNEIEMLKKSYMNLEFQKHDLEHMKMELELQKKISNKLTHECESHMKRALELEKDLSNERKKRMEHNRKSSSSLDHCLEHSEKIAHLENDCKSLEEKLSEAVSEQRKMAALQIELDDTNIKMAEIEKALVSLKKKYDCIVNERNDLMLKLANQESVIVSMKKNSEIHVDDETNFSEKIKLENESLKSKCDTLLQDKIQYRTKISELEMQLSECRRKIVIHNESNLNANNESLLETRNDSEKELNRYKQLVNQLFGLLDCNMDHERGASVQEEKLKQLELELVEKGAQLKRQKDFKKVKDERDQLIAKLKNQAKQFEQYVKNQKQVFAELNLSPRNTIEDVDFQKIREISRIEVRDEMEQKLVKKLRIMEEQHHEKRKCIEEKYEGVIKELKLRYAEKTKELQASFTAQEKIVKQMVETKLTDYRQELLSRKLKIDGLEAELKQKECDLEEKKNVMAQAMSKWAAEIQDMEVNQKKMQKEIIQLREVEEIFKKEINLLKDRINTFKHKYQSAKKTSQNYKELAEKKEKFLMGECRRIIEGYNKIMCQVQRNFDDIVSTQEKQVDEKFKEFQNQYDEKLLQVRLQMKYKDKC